MISTIFQVIAIATFGAMLAWAVYNISRPTSKRGSKTITIMAILGMMGLSYYLFPVTDKAPPPPAPFAEHNTTVLATVKEGDLILCTDPASGQVKRAVLVRSANESPQSNPFWGLSISEGYAGDMRGWASDIFEGCQLSPPIRGTQLVDERIGRIVRLGLNPPTPK